MTSALLGIAILLAINPAETAVEPLRVVLVSGAEEYHSDETLAVLKRYLEAEYRIRCVLVKAVSVDNLPGLEALDDCDVALFFTRRLTIEGDQLERVKAYALSNRPLVGVRTASHGFQNWLDFDRLVLGGNYHGHYKHEVATIVTPAPGAEAHPILRDVGPITSLGGLYRVSPPAADAHILLNGSAPEGDEPVAWVRLRDGRRVVYTSLGEQRDFDDPDFLRLLANALCWSADRLDLIPADRQEPR